MRTGINHDTGFISFDPYRSTEPVVPRVCRGAYFATATYKRDTLRCAGA
jgi:hypothetical protein